MSNPFTCMFRTLTSLTGAFLIWMSSWILVVVAILFNWLMDHTIIQFGTFYGTIKTPIEVAWTAFRDIANILIIGIFTFIAIGTILGLETFNAKKMVAKVLIIAVTINFSLLGTKMFIDASNYAATQIYTAAKLGNAGQTGTPTTPTYGIADQFMNLLGVGTFGNAYKTLSNAAETGDSNWAPLLHGILIMVVVLGAAAVLAFGCFLLLSRMIMLIFLLVTASIAFASYLVPKWSGSHYGWDAWLSSLIWCATFAPMLMFLLWMTLSVSYAVKGTSSATLGAALSDPTTGTNIVGLFNYFIVLGLLFMTFKLSSMWAGKIGGFSMAALVPALGVAGIGRLAGLAGKYTVGAKAGTIARNLSDRADRIAPTNPRLSNALKGISSRIGKAETKDFNMMNTKFGKEISGIAGLKGKFTGETKGGGIAEDNKKAAAAYAKQGEAAAKKAQKDMEDNKEKMLAEAAKSIAETPAKKEEKRLLESMERSAKEQLERSEKAQEDNREGHRLAKEAAEKQVDTTKRQAETNKKAIEESSKAVIARLERDKEYTPEGSDARKSMEDQIAAARADRDSRMNAEQANIDKAQAEATRVDGLIKADDDAVKTAKEAHAKAIDDNKKFEASIQEEAERQFAQQKDTVSAENLAGKLANSRATNLLGTEEKDDHLAKLARSQVKETREERNLKNLLKQAMDKKPEEGAAAAAPSPKADH